MKHLNKIKRPPQVNDWVICVDKFSRTPNPQLNSFLSSHLGLIVTTKATHIVGNVNHPDKLPSTDAQHPYTIYYKSEEIPDDLLFYFGKWNYIFGCRNFSRNEIIDYSDNESDLDKYLTQSRFDL